jgi:hypothetical protein
MGHHKGDMSIKGHRRIKFVFKYIKIIQPIRLRVVLLGTPSNVKGIGFETYVVSFRAKSEACSGIPYAYSNPTKDKSRPTDSGPERGKG